MTDVDTDTATDGRRRKGERRRRLLLEATMRVIERAGAAAVTQRAVAAEAAVPASAVTYYFPTVDDLLVAAVTAVNDDYLRALDACAASSRPLAALTDMIVSGTEARRAMVAAEYELFLLAARRPALRAEYARWITGLEDLLAPLVASPTRLAGAAAAVDGLLLRCYCDPAARSADDVHAILRDLTGRP